MPFVPEFCAPPLVRRFALFFKIRCCILASRRLRIRLRSCFRLLRQTLPARARWTTGLQILLAPTADFPYRHIFATEKSKIGQLPEPNQFPNAFRAHIEK